MFSQRLVEVAEQHFSWKVRQRKRYDRNPLLVTFQDKYAAKLYAKAKGIKSAEVLWLTEEPATLSFDHLPPNYFIKATHGQNWNIRCLDGQLYLYREGASLVQASYGADKPAMPTVLLQKSLQAAKRGFAAPVSVAQGVP